MGFAIGAALNPTPVDAVWKEVKKMQTHIGAQQEQINSLTKYNKDNKVHIQSLQAQNLEQKGQIHMPGPGCGV
jgi:hypothetical protein